MPPTGFTSVCGQSILISPYGYDGPHGTFSPKTAPRGLPTFGMKGTTFPTDTSLVVIPVGDNTAAAGTAKYSDNNTVYYFEPGVHKIFSVMYTGTNSVYIGGYTKALGKAVIDGVNGGTRNGLSANYLGLSQEAQSYQTWEYLTIQNYGASLNNAVLGNAIKGGPTDIGNTYKFNTIGPNEYGYRGDKVPPGRGESSGGGYAIDLLSNTTIEYNCLTQNAQGAFNGFGLNINISHNEISWNGLGVYPDSPGSGGSPYSCGCSGGGKLFFTLNANVTNNYVHDNYNAGIWLDFDNAGANISGNYVASNWGEGIVYEASYNAEIANNTLVGNGWAAHGAWPAGLHGGTCYQGVPCTDGLGPITGNGGGNPYAAIDLSDSGGNPNLWRIQVPSSIPVAGCKTRCTVPGRYNGELLVKGNVLVDNFGGIKVYTDTNRFPGNIDYDSACSISLGPLGQSNSPIYYMQTQELTTAADATITGRSVTSTGGAQTLCSNYGNTRTTESNGVQDNHPRAPTVGMAVFNQKTGRLLGIVASVKNAKSFTLRDTPGDVSKAALLLDAYGGCGPADYYGGAPGAASGSPRAQYWDNCIWGSRNVTLSGNSLTIHADSIKGCRNAQNLCGYVADEAFNAGVPTLMQFFDKYPDLIALAHGGLNNVWSRNTYTWSGGGVGQWQFWAGIQGNHVTREAWITYYGQDAHSNFEGDGLAPHPSALAFSH